MARGFDGSNKEILSASSVPLGAAPSAFTIACWFYPNNTSATDGMVYQGEDGVNDFAGFRKNSGGTVQFTAKQGGTDGDAETSNTHGANAWHHIAGVQVGVAERYCYLDGDNANRGVDATSVTASGHDTITMGAIPLTSRSNWYAGRLAEVAMWTVALSAADVAALAAGFSPDQVRPDGLVFYAPLIRDEDRDIVGGVTLTPSSDA